MNFVDAAQRVFKTTDKPLHAKAIVEKAVKNGWLKTKGKTPQHTMRVAITQEINNSEDARFEHAGPMTFRLRAAGAKTEEVKQKPERGPEPDDDEADDDRARYDFTGVAGEHWVRSKLLFENYETSKPVPDMGVDLVARKHNNSFYIQVKTANKKGNAWYFPLRVKAYKRLREVGAYHVFAMRSPSGTVRCAVMPRSIMRMLIQMGDISVVKMGKSGMGYQIRIAEKGGTYTIKEYDLGFHMDNWSL